ncbi:hypothetical protein ACH5RR_020006 [Cinchona calisaya]|uniref:Pectinesterase inhibitor domain-containing protein n=1 Tax=Cinchona calisaya TaxID=153742 RepID=A0ABD2ZG84_9GENT
MSHFSLSSLLLPLALCLVLGPHLIAAQSPANGNLIAKACEQANHKDFCINLLKSDRSSSKADLRGLAFIALHLAEKNASATALFLRDTLSKPEGDSDAVQQALLDCYEHYITAVELLEDSTSALVSDIYNDVAKFAKAAVADLDTCDASVKGLKAGSATEVANKNRDIRQLINTALTIAHVAATSKAH